MPNIQDNMQIDQNKFSKSNNKFSSLLNYTKPTYFCLFASQANFLQNTLATTSSALYSLFPSNFTNVSYQQSHSKTATTTTTILNKSNEIHNLNYFQKNNKNCNLNQTHHYNINQCNSSKNELSSTQSYILNYG